MISFLVWAATAVSCGMSIFMDGVVDIVALVAFGVTLFGTLFLSKGMFWKNLLINLIAVGAAYALGTYVLSYGYMDMARLAGLIAAVLFLMRPHLAKKAG